MKRSNTSGLTGIDCDSFVLNKNFIRAGGRQWSFFDHELSARFQKPDRRVGGRHGCKKGVYWENLLNEYNLEQIVSIVIVLC